MLDCDLSNLRGDLKKCVTVVAFTTLNMESGSNEKRVASFLTEVIKIFIRTLEVRVSVVNF